MIRRAPWIALATVVASIAASLPGAVGRGLAYERGAIRAGEVWRLATGHLVHPWPALALADLATLLALGAWLELRSRALAVSTLALSAAAASATVWLARPDLERYFGSSALACGCLAALGADHVARGASRGARAVGWVALAGLAAKLAAERWHGSLAALPDGVELAAGAHVAGALAGLASAGAASIRAPGRRSRCARAPAPDPRPRTQD